MYIDIYITGRVCLTIALVKQGVDSGEAAGGAGQDSLHLRGAPCCLLLGPNPENPKQPQTPRKQQNTKTTLANPAPRNTKLDTQILKPKPRIRISNPKPKPETRNPKPETRNPKTKT